jgi:membrane protease YdiL (CAAX protease family)
MSIPPTLAQIDESVVVWGTLVIALLCAMAAGVFRPRSVLGPLRIDPAEPLAPLWMITILTIAAFLLVPTIYSIASGKTPPGPTTAPTSQPTYTSQQMVFLVNGMELAGLVTLLIASAAWRPRGLAKLGLRLKQLPQTLGMGLVGIVIALPIALAASAATQWALDWFGIEHPNAHELLRAYDGVDHLVRIVIVIGAIVLAPIFEELLFRGHIQTAILHTVSRSGNSLWARWLAIIIASIIFTISHSEGWMMPPIFVLSICLGCAYERTGSLWVPMLMHAAFNTTNILYYIAELKH